MNSWFKKYKECNCDKLIEMPWLRGRYESSYRSECEYVHNTNIYECRLQNKCMTSDQYLASDDTTLQLKLNELKAIQNMNNLSPINLKNAIHETKTQSYSIRYNRLANFKRYGSFNPAVDQVSVKK